MIKTQETHEVYKRCTIASYISELLHRVDQAAYRGDLDELNLRQTELSGYLAALAHTDQLTLLQVDRFKVLLDAARGPFSVFGKAYWDQHAGFIIGGGKGRF